jgi:hypothetical protein
VRDNERENKRKEKRMKNLNPKSDNLNFKPPELLIENPIETFYAATKIL